MPTQPEPTAEAPSCSDADTDLLMRVRDLERAVTDMRARLAAVAPIMEAIAPLLAAAPPPLQVHDGELVLMGSFCVAPPAPHRPPALQPA